VWKTPRLRAGLAGAAACCCVVSASGELYAQQPPSRGKGALDRANGAWNRGEFDIAETLYHEAIEQGGLPRGDTLDVYVHLGATRAVLGKKDAALVAFRQAALIDPEFKPPAEAGKKAAQMAEQAKKQQLSNLGRIELHANFPKRVPAGKTFDVPVKMDPAFSTVLSKVAISVTDRLSDRTYTSDQPAGPEMSFMVPAKLVTGETSLAVRLVGLDGRDNELVAAEGRVAIEGGKATAASAAASGGASVHPPDKGPSKGFWATPWPYVLGGVALAAGGGALYYFVLRPADHIQVNQVRVE
jgi:hypothetical protein